MARLAVERGAAGLALVGRDAKTGEALAKELTSLGTKTIFISADLAKPEEPARIVEWSTRHLASCTVCLIRLLKHRVAASGIRRLRCLTR